MGEVLKTTEEVLKTTEEVLKSIEDKSEILAGKADPHFESAVKSIPIIKDFIRDNNLIIYGGTAIDYVLRLYGKNIYSDDSLALPDLDFYAPDSVQAAYNIANILFQHGYENIRAIVALYVRAMKVDIEDNHFVADIAYAPPAVFDKLPTIPYEGMRCIHPIVQFVDMHSSLSFPYDMAPTEVIFARWHKDIKRYNLMRTVFNDTRECCKGPSDAMYEWPHEPSTITCDLPPNPHLYLITGLAAYAFYYTKYVAILQSSGKKVSPDVVKVTEWNPSNTKITFDSYDKRLHLVSYDMSQVMSPESKQFYPLFSFLPSRMETDTYVCFSSAGRLLTKCPIRQDEPQIVCIQYLLMQMLSFGIITQQKQYFDLYESLHTMIVTPIGDDNQCIGDTIPEFGLPVEHVFGDANCLETCQQLQTRAINARITASNEGNKSEPTPLQSMPTLPIGYHPHKGKPPPTFAYDSTPFIRDGRVKTEK